MSELTTLHQQAMEIADEASLERIRGNTEKATELLRQAFALERSAAAMTIGMDLEPTRSVLHRSAASLALECGEAREAERLIAVALAGNPPAEIAEELRDLFEQVHFRRHLSLRGIVLQPNEFQISLSGQAIGYGFADSEVFVSRVQDLEKLVFRTAERQAKRPFRERGRRLGALARDVEMFVSTPRPGSFSISIRLGYSEQMSFPGIGPGDQVIDEIFDCIELYGKADTKALRQKIQDPTYFRNFVSLARNISPDGAAVKTVGFTSLSPTGERRVVMNRPQSEEPPSLIEPVGEIARERVSVQGVLKFADARSEKAGTLVLIDAERKPHKVRVPAGLMDDIVRPLWKYEVVVTGVRHLGGIDLEDIRKVEESESLGGG